MDSKLVGSDFWREGGLKSSVQADNRYWVASWHHNFKFLFFLGTKNNTWKQPKLSRRQTFYDLTLSVSISWACLEMHFVHSTLELWRMQGWQSISSVKTPPLRNMKMGWWRGSAGACSGLHQDHHSPESTWEERSSYLNCALTSMGHHAICVSTV